MLLGTPITQVSKSDDTGFEIGVDLCTSRSGIGGTFGQAENEFFG